MKRLLILIIAIAMTVTFMPAMAFATGYDLSSGYVILFVDDNSFSFTGSAIEPKIVVVDEQCFSDMDEDEEMDYETYMSYSEAWRNAYTVGSSNYKVSYSNNVSAGTATVTVTGKGSYSGSFSADFYINSKLIKITPKLNSDLSYTIETGVSGLKIKEIRIRDQVKALKKGTDYKVAKDGTITLTSDFTKGKTGFIFEELKNSVWFYSDPVGYIIQVKGVKCFNISKATYYDNSPLVYSGKKKSVTVKIDGLTKGTDFKVTYEKSKRSAIGKYKYTVEGIGNYTGSIAGTFKVIPKKPAKITSAKRTTSKATVKWSKVSNCSGYQVQLVRVSYEEETDEPYYVKYKSAFVKGKSTLTKTFKDVSKKKYSKVRVRAYKLVNGTKYYSKWRYKAF